MQKQMKGCGEALIVKGWPMAGFEPRGAFNGLRRDDSISRRGAEDAEKIFIRVIRAIRGEISLATT